MNKNVYHRPLVIIIFLFGSALFTQNILAQKPSVTTNIDKNHIVIGEQLHYKVSVSMPDNTYRLSWFTLPDTLGNFKVVRQNKIDSSFGNGNLSFSQVLILTSFDSGRQVIPPLALNFATLEGDSAVNAFTDSIPIIVSYNPMDSVKTFHDIKSIIEVKKEWEWWWWAILIVALILLFFWIRFLIKFLKKKNAIDLFKSKLLPYDEAMQLLADLEKEQLLQKGEVKQYHTRLTEIFKRYISRKAGTFKMNFTSDEILIELDEYNLKKEQLSAFANCIRMSNAVKFAKYIPPQTESEKCMQQTKDMITEINKILTSKPESAV